VSLSNAVRRRRGVSLSTGEVTGALGDSVTVLPIVVALGATTRVSLVHVLVLFGVFQVVWGVAYGLPLSVEPMKALAGLAIAGALTYPELAAAGLLAGVALLVLGRAGALSRLAGVVGEPAIRGVQFAVALLLLETGLDLALSTPPVAATGVGIALAVALAGYRRAGALVVLLVGAVAAALATGVPAPSVSRIATLPAVTPALTAGALEGTVAQLAMTVGNAAVATSLLCSDLFDADVSPDRLAESMGATCLAAIPLGGIPMCHGSGGLAGKHAFGARTGGANLVLGGLYLGAATVAGAGLLAAFPMALLGVLLAAVAVELGRTALDADRTEVVILAGVVGAAVNVAVGLVLGAVVAAGLRRYRAEG